MKTTITDNLLPVITPLMITLADIQAWVTIIAGVSATVAAVVSTIKMLKEMKRNKE